jgi:CheY-like chemotaxis protein
MYDFIGIFEESQDGAARADLAHPDDGVGVASAPVKNFIERHGGRVAAPAPAVGGGADAVAPAGVRRVLVVDDNVDAAESTAAFLRLEGHEVKTVNDGNEALSSVRVFAPHVIVLDIGLPGIDGYAVARRLRGEGDTSHALLIALTGYGQKDDRERATEAGFDYHFVKPTDPRQIQAAIEQGRPAKEAAQDRAEPRSAH